MSTPLPTPPLSKRKGEAETHTDFELMLRAWHSGPAGRDVALEIADRNRENARSKK